MVTDWVGYFKQAATQQYTEMDRLAFSLFDADISPLDLINPVAIVELAELHADIVSAVLDEAENRVAAELTAALIAKVK